MKFLLPLLLALAALPACAANINITNVPTAVTATGTDKILGVQSGSTAKLFPYTVLAQGLSAAGVNSGWSTNWSTDPLFVATNDPVNHRWMGYFNNGQYPAWTIGATGIRLGGDEVALGSVRLVTASVDGWLAYSGITEDSVVTNGNVAPVNISVTYVTNQYVNVSYTTNQYVNVSYTTNQYVDISYTTNLHVSKANITQYFVGNGTVTNNQYFVTNSWAGPTNDVDLTKADQSYLTWTPCQISGFINKSNTVTESLVLNITNAASTNITLYLPAGLRIPERTSSVTISNTSMGIISLRYHPAMGTNGVYRQF